MLQNSLLTGAGFNADAIGFTNQTKINNPVYLFSNIIHLVGPDQSKTDYNFSGDTALSNSQLNFTDILGKYIQAPGYNNSSVTNEQTAVLTDQNKLSEKINVSSDINTSTVQGNNQQEVSIQAQNNLSFTGLQEFLTGLFNRLSAMGFKLTQIKSLSSNSGSSQNNTVSANQNEATASSLNTDLLTLIINTQGSSNQLSKGIENNSKGSKQDSNSTQSAGDNINTIIFNLLKQNKPIVLNINFPGQDIKIEIAGLNKTEQVTGNIEKIGSAESLSAGSELSGTKIEKTAKEKTQAGKQINEIPETNDSNIQSNSNQIQINLSSPEYTTITLNKNNVVENNQKAGAANETSSKVIGKSDKKLVNSIKTDLLNIESDSIKKSKLKITSGGSSGKPAIINTEENYSPENLATQSNQVKFVDNNNSNVSNLTLLNEQVKQASNKNSDIENLTTQKAAATEDGKINLQADNKYTVTISSEDKNSYSNDINGLESILQKLNANNINGKKLINPQQKLQYPLKGIEIKNNLDSIGNGNENDTISAFLNKFSNVKVNLSSTLKQENNTNSKISDGKNIDKMNAENTSTLYSHTVKKEIFNQSKPINADKTVNVSDATSNSINKLAGALQSGDQASTGSNNHQAENNNISGANVNKDISPVTNIKAGTTGGDSGKKSDSGNKQFDNSNINSGQLINTGRSAINKNNNVNQNLNQFSDVYKTINAHELISELSGYMEQGKSKSVMLKLKPENLGKVKIVLKVADKAVHANLEVENESVKQAIQNNISSLKQSLNMNGLQLSSITVSLSGGESKSDKAFTQHQKKKTSRSLNSKKIIAEGEPVSSKNMGYNTYEYLI